MGSGGFSKVYQALKEGEAVAVKIVKKREIMPLDPTSSLQKVSMLKKLVGHLHALQFVG